MHKYLTGISFRGGPKALGFDFCDLASYRRRVLGTSLICAATLAFGLAASASQTTFDTNHVLVIDGKKIFPIGFTMPPPPEGRTPAGKNAIAELADAGANFMRTGAWDGGWSEAALQREKKYEDAAARYGLHCVPYLREYASPRNAHQDAMLEKILNTFKNHPGLGLWKGDDEPEWGNHPIPPLVRARERIHQLDPNHPVLIIHAPRGSVESLQKYLPTGDVTGADIYPISYPPGLHSQYETNSEISMVGDYTRKMMAVANGQQPVWMVLQIAWSGVVKPGKTLRMPTFAEERFMVYQAIINGARGLLFFGGNVEPAMSPRDKELGWNWTFWNRVLRPVIEEIGDKSLLHQAMVAPHSKLPIANHNSDIEFCVREVGSEIFLLACKRGPKTEVIEFNGFPDTKESAEVLYESPRTVKVKQGKLSDWFGPFEVHVYRLRRR
jgi:hypothetical protein